MKSKGLTLIEGLIAAGVILLVGGLIVFAAVDTSRRARDAARLSDMRQVQASLERAKSLSASYPASLDGIEGLPSVSGRFTYAAQPEGCGPDLEVTCRSYALSFALEGPIGALSGGACKMTPDSVSCTRAR